MARISVRRTQTRERLLDSAMEVFAERGILAASVEEICERAGFTRGAFYSNYESKDDICAEIAWRIEDDRFRQALAILSNSLQPGRIDLDRLSEQVADLLLEVLPHDRTQALFLFEIGLHASRSPRFRRQYPVDTEVIGMTQVLQTANRAGLQWAVSETVATDLLIGLAYRVSHMVLTEGPPCRERMIGLTRPMLGMLLHQPGIGDPAAQLAHSPVK